MNTSINLNLGCSGQIIDGWINVDYALGARLSKIPFFKTLNKYVRFFEMDWDNKIFIHNLTKPLPWKNESVDIIYSSHTLEHLTKAEGFKLLQECTRVLKPNGIIRIMVPDLQCVVNDYNANKFPANEFIERIDALYIDKGSKIKLLLAPLVQFPHKCMYDARTLLSIISKLGINARSRTAFESAIPNIRSFEIPERTQFAVIIEGQKTGIPV